MSGVLAFIVIWLLCVPIPILLSTLGGSSAYYYVIWISVGVAAAALAVSGKHRRAVSAWLLVAAICIAVFWTWVGYAFSHVKFGMWG